MQMLLAFAVTWVQRLGCRVHSCLLLLELLRLLLLDAHGVSRPHLLLLHPLFLLDRLLSPTRDEPVNISNCKMAGAAEGMNN